MKVQRAALLLAIGVLLAGLPAAVAAQQTSQSLADAARKAKEQQKQAPKAKIVWTNDNLPTTASVSVVGQAAQPADATNTNEAQPNAKSGTEVPENADSDSTKVSAELADAQKQLDSAKTDLDIAQREYKLDSDQYYSTPDYASDQQGKEKLDTDKSQVEAKQQAVDEAQKKVDELQKELDSLATSAPKD
jgi:glucose/arabinose dehydrogenase